MAKRQVSRRGEGLIEERPVLEGELVAGSDALATDDDYLVVSQAGPAVRGLLGGLVAFFTTARELEREALETLADAKALRAPSSAAEDERVQRFVVETTKQRKVVEDHWKITTTISAFHRRLTARRAKATDALEQANKLANQVHNAYVERERQRVLAEQRRLEEEARAAAQAERERELQALEDAALAREAASTELSAREQTFVEAYFRTRDAIGAARSAGYKDPAKTGPKLLNLDKVAGAIKAKQEAEALRKQQAALKARELDTALHQMAQPTPTANVTKATGTSSRTYHYGDVVDAEALLQAVLSGQYGIPTDILQINPSKVNEYAGQLFERVNRWPGVRYRKETKVV